MVEKKEVLRVLYIFIIVIHLIFISSLTVFAEDLSLTSEENISDQEKAISCLENSWLIHEELLLNNFSVRRINDTIRDAEASLEIQQSLEERGRSADYSKILTTCNEISSLRDLAFQLRDEIDVLDEFYSESSQGIDTSEIDKILAEVYAEMRNERYEFVPDLIEKTYSEIILAQSRLATLNVFYDATTRGLKRFINERWRELIVGIFVFIVLIFLLKKPVERFILRKQLEDIEVRRKSLKGMISDNQDAYFNKGKMSEDSFTVKNKKLAELIRDVDREISLLKEQIYDLDNGKKTNNALKNKISKKSENKISKTLKSKKTSKIKTKKKK